MKSLVLLSNRSCASRLTGRCACAATCSFFFCKMAGKVARGPNCPDKNSNVAEQRMFISRTGWRCIWVTLVPVSVCHPLNFGLADCAINEKLFVLFPTRFWVFHSCLGEILVTYFNHNVFCLMFVSAYDSLNDVVFANNFNNPKPIVIFVNDICIDV